MEARDRQHEDRAAGRHLPPRRRLLVGASFRTLRKLTAVNIPIRTTATTIPVVVRTFAAALLQPAAREAVVLAVLVTADTSIGATVAACSHENQPKNDAPAAPPNA